MGAPVIRRPRSSQPQAPAQIDRSNSFGRSVVASVNPAVSYSAGLNRPVALTSGVSRVSTPKGVAFQHSASNGGVDIGASGGLASLVAPGNPFSIFLRIYVPTLGVRQALVGDHNSGGTGNAIDLEITAANAWQLTLANVNSQQEGGTFGTVTTGWHDVLVTYVPLGAITLYVDGVSIGTGTSIATIRTGTSLRVGAFGVYPSLGFLGKTVVGHIFNRALSATDAAALSANAWQPYKAPMRRLWYGASTAPTSITGDLAWTEADDALSIGGVITDPATEGWAEADDAHALAGTVTDRAVAAWTEADDVHAMVGVVTDSDALWWIEADDVVSIAGTVQTPSVDVTASIAWVEADDAVALVGGVSISGVATWVEADDIVRITGALPSSMDMHDGGAITREGLKAAKKQQAALSKARDEKDARAAAARDTLHQVLREAVSAKPAAVVAPVIARAAALARVDDDEEEELLLLLM